MQVTLSRSVTFGTVRAIASKSVAHRLLICAAFADAPSVIRCEESNEDINATVNCLCALGATITRDDPFFNVSPIKKFNKKALLPCNESGSTLRFLVPICAAIGGEFTFDMKGKLPQRPLSPLKELLEENGVTFSKVSDGKLTITGKLNNSDFKIAGNVSSQFITGLLFALTFSNKNATLTVTNKLESAPYVDITLDALALFGVKIEKSGNLYRIPQIAKLSSPKEISVEGDWSNAAFPLALGIIGKRPITVSNLSLTSSQGDKKIIDVLTLFGGEIAHNDSSFTASPSKIHSIELDASDIPDLVPIIATVAAVADGKTVIRGAARLKIKESDRLIAISTVLSTLGASITPTDDGLIIEGTASLRGGKVSSFGDHRIAMCAAIASAVSTDDVVIDGAEAVNKSYPLFWKDICSVGMKITEKHI